MKPSRNVTNMREAKTQFRQLVERALKGEDVIITRHGKPVVRLVRYFPETSWNKTFQDWLKHGEAFDLELGEYTENARVKNLKLENWV